MCGTSFNWLASGLGVNLKFDDHFDNSNAAICSHFMSQSNSVESVSSVYSCLNTYLPVWGLASKPQKLVSQVIYNNSFFLI